MTSWYGGRTDESGGLVTVVVGELFDLTIPILLGIWTFSRPSVTSVLTVILLAV